MLGLMLGGAAHSPAYAHHVGADVAAGGHGHASVHQQVVHIARGVGGAPGGLVGGALDLEHRVHLPHLSRTQ
eukprot:1185472-Prorocentrum_minimum.AAC.4